MKKNMDDGGVEISDSSLLLNWNSHQPTSINAILDEFLKNTRTCTHTHTCNPPGPDAAHTHTCHHTHTQLITSEDDDEPKEKQQCISKSGKLSGNREAVRKYREKKKAHTAYLEEEVKKLRLLNQQLLRKLQGQALLEAEVLRLRTLLLDLRGKIDAELGVFPFQKQCTASSFKEGDCGLQSIDVEGGLQCETDLPCLHQVIGSSSVASICSNGKMIPWEGSYEPAIVDCQANQNGDLGQNLANAAVQVDCLIPNAMDVVGSIVSTTPHAK